jgi:hypothetical protein
MLDFPNSPTLNQVFTAPSGVAWLWDGVKWIISTGTGATFVPNSGGTMTGLLVLSGDPTLPLGAADKQYVDASSAAVGLLARYGDNRIINGDMRIDQRNNGASGTAINSYSADRWIYTATQTSKLTWQRTGSTAPGFPYSMLFTSSSAYTPLTSDYFAIIQPIEADFISDFAWGTSGAQPVTLSFLVWCTLTGTFGGSLRSYAGTRSYPFTYSIPVASTWTKITITIPGDTTGTWTMSSNAGSLYVEFDLGSGASCRSPAGTWATVVSPGGIGANGCVNLVATSGAQLLITGVKLEIGSTATAFQHILLSESFAACQRYYQPISALILEGYFSSSATILSSYVYLVAMRSAPAITFSGQSYLNASGLASNNIATNACSLQITTTAVGLGYCTFNLILTSEL